VAVTECLRMFTAIELFFRYISAILVIFRFRFHPHRSPFVEVGSFQVVFLGLGAPIRALLPSWLIDGFPRRYNPAATNTTSAREMMSERLVVFVLVFSYFLLWASAGCVPGRAGER